MQVVYGFIELKTHAKLSLVVRREGGALASYVHVGTGNYHPVTARIYTDLSFFTADPVIARDVGRDLQLHHRLRRTGRTRDVWQSLRSACATASCEHIAEEIAHARGRQASRDLDEDELRWSIRRSSMRSTKLRAPALRSTWWCAASAACGPACRACPRTSAPNRSSGDSWSTDASIVSATGHGLPHPNAAVYISSADMMPRNLDRRVEALCPILNPTVHEQVLESDHAGQSEGQRAKLGVSCRMARRSGSSRSTAKNRSTPINTS
mgnify:CR=1 FL=1